MNISSGLTTIRNLDIDVIVRQAAQDGCKVFVLPSSGVIARESLFAAVRGCLPLDPPVITARSWDALSDSLWEGLNCLDAECIVIIWPNSTAMRDAAATDHEVALRVLADVANLLVDPAMTQNSGKKVSVLLGE